MAVDTHVERARSRARAEREAIDDKLAAYEAFVRRVAETPPNRPPPSVAGITTDGGATHRPADASSDGCRSVRTAFDETIRPHSVADVDDAEPLLETVREEFTDGVAAALAPTTGATFTPELKELVLAEARSRRSEATAVQRALDREEAHLDGAAERVDAVVEWLVDANETALSDLGFDALRRRHETLAGHRDRCAAAARDRQEFLAGAANGGSGAVVGGQSLVQYLYWGFPVDHPVLATVAKLDATCRECQRAVRDHLVRRV